MKTFGRNWVMKMSEEKENSIANGILAWDYVVGKLSSEGMTPAEVLHVYLNYCNRGKDYGEILREVREDLKDRDDLPREVKEHLGTESVGEFVEFDNWMWSKKIDKKYEPIIDLLLNFKVKSEQAIKTIVLGLYANQDVSLSKAAELYGLPLSDFMELLAEKGIPTVRYNDEMLEEDLKGVEELVAKRAELPENEWIELEEGKSIIENYNNQKYEKNFPGMSVEQIKEVRQEAMEHAEKHGITDPKYRAIRIRKYMESYHRGYVEATKSFIFECLKNGDPEERIKKWAGINDTQFKYYKSLFE